MGVLLRRARSAGRSLGLAGLTRACGASQPHGYSRHRRRLQDDLRRAGIEPFGWVINASLAASASTHPTLKARAALEARHIARVQDLSARGIWLVDWQPQAPVGLDALRQLTAGRVLTGFTARP